MMVDLIPCTVQGSAAQHITPLLGRYEVVNNVTDDAKLSFPLRKC